MEEDKKEPTLHGQVGKASCFRETPVFRMAVLPKFEPEEDRLFLQGKMVTMKEKRNKV